MRLNTKFRRLESNGGPAATVLFLENKGPGTTSQGQVTSSRVDYCYLFYVGLAVETTCKWFEMLLTGVGGGGLDSIIWLLWKLSWLPINFCPQFKVLVLNCTEALRGLGPGYLEAGFFVTSYLCVCKSESVFFMARPVSKISMVARGTPFVEWRPAWRRLWLFLDVLWKWKCLGRPFSIFQHCWIGFIRKLCLWIICWWWFALWMLC